MRYPTILLALFCVACGSYSSNVPSIKPYKMDIQQGNVVTPKMMMQLRPGMTKSQVRFIMGTPLLVDSFHSDRWDYFYQMRKDGKIIEQRRIILDFDGDALAHVRGDVVPAGGDASGQPAAPANAQNEHAVSPVPKAKEKGLLDKLKFWEGDDQKTSQPKPVEQAKPVPKPEPKAMPAADAAPESAPAEAPLPPLMDDAPQSKPVVSQEPPAKPVEVKGDKPKEDKKGWLDKLKFWEGDEQPQAAPVPSATPSEQTRPVVKSESKPAVAAEKAPVAKVKPQPEAALKTPPPPSKDLPAEDAPDFFEKMLEKIGF